MGESIAWSDNQQETDRQRRLAQAFVLGAVSVGVPIHSNEAKKLSEGLGLTWPQLSATLAHLTHVKAVVTDWAKPEAEQVRLAEGLEIDVDSLAGQIGDRLAELDLERAMIEVEADFAARDIKATYDSFSTTDESIASSGSDLVWGLPVSDPSTVLRPES
jgi:hypothetical protein